MERASPPLSSQVATVTGAGRGCGAAVARALAAAGARVCVSDLNPDRARQVAGEIIASGGQAFDWQADISNRFQVAGLIETTRDRFGRLDIFVQAAHVSPHGPALTMGDWEWQRTLEVNLTGTFFCAQLAGRVMADEGGGLIALLVRPPDRTEQAAFATTQAGLVSLADALAAEWVGKGVRVGTVEAKTPEETARRVLALCDDE